MLLTSAPRSRFALMRMPLSVPVNFTRSTRSFFNSSVILLFSRIGALRQVPASSTTVPPPLPAEQSSIAFWIAAVSLVVPSPLAPYFFASHTLPAAITGPAASNTQPATAIHRTQPAIFIASPSVQSALAASYLDHPAARHIDRKSTRLNSSH